MGLPAECQRLRAMPQRWVLACVAEVPEVIANSVLFKVHVPVLVDACVACGRVQLASTVSIGDASKAPAPHSRGPGVGRGSLTCLSPEVRRRCGLAEFIPAPAGDRTVAPHPAGVERPGVDGDEGTRGRRGLAVVIAVPVIAAPAGDGTVAPHPAGVYPPPALTETKEPAGGVAWP